MSEARWEMEKEQQIYENIEMYDEVRRMSTSGCGYHRTGWNPSAQRVDDVATDETNEKSVPTLRNIMLLSKKTEEPQSWYTQEMHDGRQVGCRKEP